MILVSSPSDWAKVCGRIRDENSKSRMKRRRLGAGCVTVLCLKFGVGKRLAYLRLDSVGRCDGFCEKVDREGWRRRGRRRVSGNVLKANEELAVSACGGGRAISGPKLCYLVFSRVHSAA